MSEPNPNGELVTCVGCQRRVTFTRDALCDGCRKPRKLPPSKVPEVNR